MYVLPAITHARWHPVDLNTVTGNWRVQEKKAAHLGAILEMVNRIHDGEITDQDKFVHMNKALHGNPRSLGSSWYRSQIRTVKFPGSQFRDP